MLLTVPAMECFAWFSHKYIMHGILWNLHKSHHSKSKRLLERNDLFGVLFGIISCLFIVFGNTFHEFYFLFWIGIGILIYGFIYFVFHDIIVHQRVKYSFSTKSRYLKRIIKAHLVHHKTYTKAGAEAFGFLFAHEKYSSKKN